MIRFLLRTLGLLAMAVAFVLFVYDGTKSIAANTLIYTRISEVWTLLHPSSLQQLRPVVEAYGTPWLWDPVALTVLEAPAFAVFAIVGAVLMLLGRRKK